MTTPFIPQGQSAAAPAPQRPPGGYGYDSSQIPAVPQQQVQQQVPQPGQQQQQVPQQQQIQQQNQPVPNLQLQQGGQQQQQQQAPAATDLTQTLQGEHIPPQLRGRSVGEALGYFNAMLNVIRSGSPQQQAPQQSHVPSASSMQPAQQPGQNQQQQAAAPATEFFRDPQAAIGKALAEQLPGLLQGMLGPVLQPIAQNAMASQAQQAQQAIVNEIGVARYQALYPHMVQYLSTLPAQSLGSVDTWRLAARAAAGELALSGRLGPPQPNQNQQQQAPQGQNNYGTPAAPYPVQTVGPNGQPLPGLASFFTESPSGSSAGGRVQLSALQESARQAMNMDPDTYVAWLGGVQPVRR